MGEAEQEGKDVGRLHTGEPSIYGAVQEQMQELDNAEEMEQDIQSSSSFEQKGTVYEDPETGKLYVVMPKSGN